MNESHLIVLIMVSERTFCSFLCLKAQAAVKITRGFREVGLWMLDLDPPGAPNTAPNGINSAPFQLRSPLQTQWKPSESTGNTKMQE